MPTQVEILVIIQGNTYTIQLDPNSVNLGVTVQPQGTEYSIQVDDKSNPYDITFTIQTVEEWVFDDPALLWGQPPQDYSGMKGNPFGNAPVQPTNGGLSAVLPVDVAQVSSVTSFLFYLQLQTGGVRESRLPISNAQLVIDPTIVLNPPPP